MNALVFMRQASLSYEFIRMQIKASFVVICILFCVSAYVQSIRAATLEYARHLMDERDYFRAISVYKEIDYYSKNDTVKQECKYQIAKAYFKSSRNKTSIQYFVRLLNGKKLLEKYQSRSYVYLGLNYYELRVLPKAEEYLLHAAKADRGGYAKIYLSLIEAEKGDWQRSSEILNELENNPNSELSNMAEELNDYFLVGKHIKYISPRLAATLSFFLPGSGQFYAKHYFDGIQAFLYVSAFLYVTYLAYRYDSKVNKGSYLNTIAAGSVTVLFHAANIIGAHKTAQYRNFRVKKEFFGPIRIKVFALDF